jgi:hypothetical protein
LQRRIPQLVRSGPLEKNGSRKTAFYSITHSAWAASDRRLRQSVAIPLSHGANIAEETPAETVDFACDPEARR